MTDAGTFSTSLQLRRFTTQRCDSRQVWDYVIAVPGTKYAVRMTNMADEADDCVVEILIDGQVQLPGPPPPPRSPVWNAGRAEHYLQTCTRKGRPTVSVSVE
jgi:hypothetical protein